MTEITRELLDAVIGAQGITSLEHGLAAALRRVLDLADEADEGHARYMEGPILDRFIAPSNVHTSKLRAALAGTQTDEPDVRRVMPGEAWKPAVVRGGTQTESLPEPDRSASCSTCGHARGAHFSGQCIGNRNLCGCLVFAGTQTERGDS